MTFIQVENVSKIFGNNPQDVMPMISAGNTKSEIQRGTGHIVGLRNVSLSMDKGKIHVVMGLSGSGKSTLIRHFNRLIDPTSGVITIDGQNILELSRKELQKFRQTRISMVFQNFGLMPHRTVLENVSYGLEVRGEPKEKREKAARQWISRVGLQGYESNYPHNLSGGMKQRVGLARALVTNPDILLMDEAFSALDPLIRQDMQLILLDLHRELKKTIVFITHDLDEALAIGDQIAVLRDGQLAQVGSPQDIILHPADAYVRRFIRNVNRARALTISAIMSPTTEDLKSEASVHSSDTLERALPKVVGSTGPVRVLGDDGKLCGTISAKRIVETISG
jgi:glycine betaine/proline transport system ATP-binding protein